ncbi:MAG: hypothetical protein IPI42_04840 [Saprospiraceae bacterium]|nr:hypothetical protein [Candidatus Parvibacillus calidus]
MNKATLRRNTVLKRMCNNGILSESDYEKLSAEVHSTILNKDPYRWWYHLLPDGSGQGSITNRQEDGFAKVGWLTL